MRHEATLVAALEGITRPAFQIARELAANSRSGLTIRFLAKKLEQPEEEIEYLIDIHHKLFFHDITKIKLVGEGGTAVKRIQEGLESRGDVPALQRQVKALPPHEYRLLEEVLGIDKPGPKKQTAEVLVQRCYETPESVVEYVARGEFSDLAREMFDLIWQSKEGLIPIADIRRKLKESEYKLEQALSEMVNGGVLFEMFRFDDRDRLVRVIGLLAELRNFRAQKSGKSGTISKLKSKRGTPELVRSYGFRVTDAVCRLVASIAAKPARLRGDGELFREDRRRLEDIVGDDDEPDLQASLWFAELAGWLARVDNELRATELDPLVESDRAARHRTLFNSTTANGSDAKAWALFSTVAASMKVGQWYRVSDVVTFAVSERPGDAEPTLQYQGGHWAYTQPGASGTGQKAIAGALDESLVWFGVVDRSGEEDEALISLTDIGQWLLAEDQDAPFQEEQAALTAEFVVQPNFDIVVPGQDTDPLVTVPLDQFADRQSTGTAIVYNLSKESFTRAIQEGHDGDAFVQFLMTHNRSGDLPSNVLQSLDDWRGSVKRVRVRTIHVLESDDPLVIADLMHRRRLSKYFNSVDPQKTIAFSKTSKAEITRELEKEGFVVG